MQFRSYGGASFQVSSLGFGAMHINDERVSEEEADRLLNQVLDLGINLIDTARGYGLSEERIGRFIAHRRSEYVLSTKVGYGVEGCADWTYDCIQAGVERALRMMRTDYLDIVHLHSCPLATLQQGEVTESLWAMQRQGKIRVVAYSGENEALDFAIASGAFGGVQASLNVCDQHSLGRLVSTREKNIGFIAKRPLAGAIWRATQRPSDFAEGLYWDRWQTMHLDARGLNWGEIAIRFSAYHDGVASCIVGSRNIAHMKQHIESIAKGPLPVDWINDICETYRRHDRQWYGVV